MAHAQIWKNVANFDYRPFIFQSMHLDSARTLIFGNRHLTAAPGLDFDFPQWIKRKEIWILLMDKMFLLKK